MPKLNKLALLISTTLLFAQPLYAVDKIYSPTVDKGEIELEYFATRDFDSDRSKDNAQVHETSIGYGVNDYWKTEFYANFAKQPDQSLKTDSFEWENIFAFSQPGQYWLDSGMSIAYVHNATARSADAVEAKLLLQKQIGQWINIANIGLEEEIGRFATGRPERSFAWETRYNLNKYFNPGFEFHSDFGRSGDDSNGFSEQVHFIGPAAYGRILDNLKYEAAYLVGVSNAAPQSEAKLLLEYEFRF
ncbi:MAG: hypothetical protein WCL30_06270 [Pseudomonadota bacterium]